MLNTMPKMCSSMAVGKSTSKVKQNASHQEILERDNID
jgi:hypothetical protein